MSDSGAFDLGLQYHRCDKIRARHDAHGSLEILRDRVHAI